MNKISRRWRITALCTLIGGAIVAAPVVALTGLVSASTVQDKIIYVQASGQQKTGPFVEYVGGNGTTLTQSLSLSSGSCSSSKVSNPTSPLLPMTASYYGTAQPPYSGTPTAATVASAQTSKVAETGVCVTSKVSAGNTIQPNEGLVFGIGSNSLTAGRVFSQATIPLKRNDPTKGSLSGTLVLRRANQVVDKVPFSVPAAGTESENDTNDCPVISTGVVPAADQFDQLEIQVDSPSSGSVSVVGPNCDNDNDKDDVAVPTFYLDTAPTISSANLATFNVGGGQQSFSVTTTGLPTPTLTNAAFNGCTPTTLPNSIGFTTTAGSGTATISGSPVSGDGGTYILCINASDSAGTATQVFTLTIDQAPAITSSNTVTFTAGASGSNFMVTATGYPVAALSESGSLPSGVTFTDNGTGTATITNSPAAGTGGSYAITITAANGVSPNATQSFTLIVDQPPTITSASSVTFAAGGSGSNFTVTTAGYPGGPTLTLGESGPLPSGVTFTDNGDGTATITNSAAADSGGSYKITITASNTISPDATQSFTIDVNQAPAFTSQPTDIVPAGSPFSYSVTTSGNPTPAITNASFEGCTPSTLPSSVSFADNGGTATISGNPADADAGTYTLCLNATNGVSPAATQSFTLVITAPGAPFQATQENGSPVAASIQLNSGSKSFVDFTTSGDTKGDETVEWNTTNGTGTYNATAVLTWIVPYCTPGTGPSPECGPTDIAFTVNGTPQPQTFCLASSPPSDPNSSNWCTTNIAYSFLDPGNTGTATETQITETWNGQGDPTWSR